jgi:outer membrane lipoprotein carrier protein
MDRARILTDEATGLRKRRRSRGLGSVLLALTMLFAGSPAQGNDVVSSADAIEAAPGGCVESAVAAVQRRYQSVRDLRADFVQTSLAVAFGAPAGGEVESSGTVAFAKPGKMRWSYEAPDPSLVVSDGETLVLYDPVHGEAQRLPVGDGYLSGAAIQFLLGEGEILTAFHVSALSCEADVAKLELIPREPASYEKLAIGVDRKSGDILHSTVFDLLGNQTRIAFTNLRTNTDPDPALFTFDPPAGVKLIDLKAGGAP